MGTNEEKAKRAMRWLRLATGSEKVYGFSFPTRAEYKARYRAICARWPGVYPSAESDLDIWYSSYVFDAMKARAWWLSEEVLSQDCLCWHLAVRFRLRSPEWAESQPYPAHFSAELVAGNNEARVALGLLPRKHAVGTESAS